MGSASSIDTSKFPEDIRKIYMQSEQMKQEIALHDARFLKVQSSQAWKDHKKIIGALTERTKGQLQRVAAFYTKLELEDGRNIRADIEIRNMLGGSYGDFMRLLLLSTEEINAELLETALKCIGCDECLLSDVLCACSTAEMNRAIQQYNATHAEPLANAVKSKTLENSNFQKFILKVISTQRNQENVFDEGKAVEQMELLHAAFEKSGGKDDETIFSIMAEASRQQCDLISEKYEKKYNLTLDAIITSKYAGSCARALVLWSTPLLASIASLFHMSLSNAVVDFDQTCHLATKYQKNVLQQVVVAYQTMYHEDLLQRLGKVLTGNFKKSVIAWFNNKTYDDGCESKIQDLIDSCNGSLDNLVNNPTKLDDLRQLVQSEFDATNKHLEAAEAATSDNPKNPKKPKDSVPIAPPLSKENREVLTRMSSGLRSAPDAIAVAKDSSAGPSQAKVQPDAVRVEPALPKGAESINVSEDSSSAPAKAELKETPPPVAVAAVIAAPSKRKQLGYEEKFKLICDYLLERFKQDDLDDSGTLDSNEFFQTLSRLHLGYTDEELAGIQHWTDYDGDGVVTYAEVVNELADSLIDIIEGAGMTVEEKVAQLWAENKEELQSLWDEYQGWSEQQEQVSGDEQLSPSLTQYLKDSFEAFDVDRSGTLDSNEFWSILVALMGLTEGDVASMQVDFDADKDGKVTWAEALDEFTKIFRSKVNQKMDYWIGLVDKSTNKLFWFNVRDETSFWMCPEDEAKYKECISLGAGREVSLAPMEVPSALISSKNKSFDTNMKSLREFKSMKKNA